MSEVLDYLDQYALAEAPVAREIEWAKVDHLFTEVKKFDGILLDRTKFSSPAFPQQNLDSFKTYFIHTNTQARSCFLSTYDKASPKGPDCFSTNGVHPFKPFTYHGQVILNCDFCPVKKSQHNPEGKCKTDPYVYAVAVFDNDVYVPWVKHLPITSLHPFTAIINELSAPVEINGQKAYLPFYVQEVEVFPDIREYKNQSYQVWGFRKTGNYAPATLAAELKKMAEVVVPKFKADEEVRLLAPPTVAAPLQIQTTAPQPAALPGTADILLTEADIPFN